MKFGTRGLPETAARKKKKKEDAVELGKQLPKG